MKKLTLFDQIILRVKLEALDILIVIIIIIIIIIIIKVFTKYCTLQTQLTHKSFFGDNKGNHFSKFP